MKLKFQGMYGIIFFTYFFKNQSHHENLVREFLVIVCDLHLFQLFSVWSKRHSKRPLLSHTPMCIFSLCDILCFTDLQNTLKVI